MIAASELAIDLDHVTKRYGSKVRALDGVAMRVYPGEVFGLLGPNGAGKSTLVKILMTIVRPTRVVGTLLGAPIGRKSTLRHIGYLPENPRFPDYLTGRQALDYYAALAHVDRRTRRRRAGELLDMVQLARWADYRVGQYSKGMRQRIGLAQALMNDPRLVFLDEPTDGLDPVGRNFVRDLLIRLRAEGRTVFLNSHLLSEVEQVCDRLAILKAGRVVRQGRLQELTAGSVRYQFQVQAPASGETWSPARLHQAIKAALPCVWSEDVSGVEGTLFAQGRLESGVVVEVRDAVVEVPTDDAPTMQPLLDAIRQSRLVVASLQARRQTLEDLFFNAMAETGGAADTV